MGIAGIFLILLALAPFLLTLLAWITSLFLAPKGSASFVQDFKQLAKESIPFLKTQWLFILLCGFGSNFAMLQNVNHDAHFGCGIMPLILSCLVFGTLFPILELFFVSYLAKPKFPFLVSTIGLWTVIVYSWFESLRSLCVFFGLTVFVVPGIIIVARTSLYLPAFALKGHRGMDAIIRSWNLTQGKTFVVIRYLGVPVMVSMLASRAPSLVTSCGIHTGNVAAIMPVFTIATTITVMANLITAGLAYKLYARLVEDTNPTASLD